MNSIYYGATYELDYYGTLHIYYNGVKLQSVANCQSLDKKAIETIIYGVLEEHGYL